MTTQPGLQPPPPPGTPGKPAPFLITAAENSHLADLLDRRDAALARAEDAKALAESLTAAIKNEVTAACPPGLPVIDIDSPRRPRLRLAWRTPKRFTVDKFKRDYPGLYEQFREWGTPYWELRKLS